MALAIRAARKDDVDGIFEVRTSVTENRLTLEQLTGFGITKAAVTEMIERASCAWVALDAEKVVGFSMADLDKGSVFAVFVLPAYERRGLGRALLQAAEEALFRQHAVIWLETGKTTRAAEFYRRRGWGNQTDISDRHIRLEKARP